VTDSEINIAIAESLGEIDPRYTTTGGFIASYVINGVTVGFHGLPNYTSDLNACHKFEKVLQNQFATLEEAYFRNLQYVKPHPIYATARQRCEAYLRTIGKWIE